MLGLGLGLGLWLGGRARDRTSLELRLGLVRVSCIIKEWFKQNSAAMSRFPSCCCACPSNEHGL